MSWGRVSGLGERRDGGRSDLVDVAELEDALGGGEGLVDANCSLAVGERQRVVVHSGLAIADGNARAGCEWVRASFISGPCCLR